MRNVDTNAVINHLENWGYIFDRVIFEYKEDILTIYFKEQGEDFKCVLDLDKCVYVESEELSDELKDDLITTILDFSEPQIDGILEQMLEQVRDIDVEEDDKDYDNVVGLYNNIILLKELLCKSE